MMLGRPLQPAYSRMLCTPKLDGKDDRYPLWGSNSGYLDFAADLVYEVERFVSCSAGSRQEMKVTPMRAPANG
jgi:hypothetical protein